MRKIYIVLLVLAALFASVSCKREPIVYPTGNYYLEVNLNEIHEDLQSGSLWQVLMYDPATGMKVYETFITPLLHPAGMPTGGYIIGVQPGEYDLVVFNRDTRVTSFNFGDASRKLYAYAPNSGYNGDTPIVFEPDELYVWQATVKIPYVSGDDVHIVTTKPKTILDTREIVVHGVKNLDIAQNIALYVSRQDRGSWLCPIKKLNERCIVVAEGEVRFVGTKADDDDKGLVIWTPFSTFGAMDGDDGKSILLTVAIEGPNGSIYYAQADITDQWMSGQKIIETTLDVEVEPLQQGGFDPHANEWDVFITDIELG